MDSGKLSVRAINVGTKQSCFKLQGGKSKEEGEISKVPALILSTVTVYHNTTLEGIINERETQQALPLIKSSGVVTG